MTTHHSPQASLDLKQANDRSGGCENTGLNSHTPPCHATYPHYSNASVSPALTSPKPHPPTRRNPTLSSPRKVPKSKPFASASKESPAHLPAKENLPPTQHDASPSKLATLPTSPKAKCPQLTGQTKLNGNTTMSFFSSRSTLRSPSYSSPLTDLTDRKIRNYILAGKYGEEKKEALLKAIAAKKGKKSKSKVKLQVKLSDFKHVL